MSVPTEESAHSRGSRPRRVRRSPRNDTEPGGRGKIAEVGTIKRSPRVEALVSLDEHGRILTVNRPAESLFGYRRSDLLGASVDRLIPQGSASLLSTADADPPGPMVLPGLTGRRRDGSAVTLDVTVRRFFSEHGQRTLAVFQPGATERPVEDATARPEAAQGELRRHELEVAISADRQRIAQDLHDSVIQRLFATAMSVQSLRVRLRPPFDAEAARIVDELDRSVAEIRTVIFRLQPEADSAVGLRAALLTVLEQERAALGFSPTVRMTGDLPDASGDWIHHVCAIIRELLSNVARHAHAGGAEIELESGDLIVLRVSDDGVGFDPGPIRRGLGVGNVTERASELGGSLLIHRRPAGGTTVECILPRPDEAG
jgi:PAS domain S-box-containing protein